METDLAFMSQSRCNTTIFGSIMGETQISKIVPFGFILLNLLGIELTWLHTIFYGQGHTLIMWFIINGRLVNLQAPGRMLGPEHVRLTNGA